MSKKRRNFTAQFKLETVLDGLRGEKTVPRFAANATSPNRCTTSGATPLWSGQRAFSRTSAGHSAMSKLNGLPSWSGWQASRRWSLRF